MDELDRQLHQQGHLDSQGSFQIDWDKAREKFARYQIAEPRTYILKLVQWAVASRARSVDLKIDAQQVVVEHDGDGQDHSSMLATSGHLGIALLSLSQLKPQEIVLESRDYRWSNGTLTPSQARPGSRLTLRGLKPPGWWHPVRMLGQQRSQTFMHVDTDGVLGGLIWDSLGFVRPEVALVRQRCFLAGIPVILNGQAVNRPADLAYRVRGNSLTLSSGRPQAARFKFVVAPEWRSANLCVPGGALGNIPCSYLDDHGRATRGGVQVPELSVEGRPVLSALAVLYHSAADARGEVLHWVHDGVLVEIEVLQRRQKLYYTYCHCQGLQTDLSQFRLVRDEAYQQRLEWLSKFRDP